MKSFGLNYLANEDEAEMTGYVFEVHGDKVILHTTYHHPEYEHEPEFLTRQQARDLWKRLVRTGDWRPYDVWVSAKL